MRGFCIFLSGEDEKLVWLILLKLQFYSLEMQKSGRLHFYRKRILIYIPRPLSPLPRLIILHPSYPCCGMDSSLHRGTNRRISKGSTSHSSKEPISPLRDNDQPFVFDISFFDRPYRFEFYDTSSPEHWALLKPDVIVLCYDISSRLSLINIQRVVRLILCSSLSSALILPSGEMRLHACSPRPKSSLYYY